MEMPLSLRRPGSTQMLSSSRWAAKCFLTSAGSGNLFLIPVFTRQAVGGGLTMTSVCSKPDSWIAICNTAIDWGATGNFWSSIATFTTGALAVGAAIYVARTQNAILARQTTLQELTMRNEVFDKRLLIYRTIRVHVSIVMVAKSFDALPEIDFSEFEEAIEEAQFLFSKRLFLEIKSLHLLVSETAGSLHYQEYDGHNDDERTEVEETTKRRQRLLKAKYMAMPAQFDLEMHMRTREESFADFIADVQLPDVSDELPSLLTTPQSRWARLAKTFARFGRA